MSARVARPLAVAGGVLALVALWAVVGVFDLGTHGAVPTPWAVAHQAVADGFDLYWRNASVTLQGAGQGFLWGNGIALLLAVVVLLVPVLEPAAEQIAVISYCMPLTAIGPIVLVVFGGRAPEIFLAAMSVFFTTLVGALLGVRSADRAALDVVRAYGGNLWQQLVRVQVIAALPSIINALKLSAPAAMLGAILGEYLGGVDSGIGVALTASQQQFNVPRTWALALLVGLIAGLGYGFFSLLGRFATPWSRGTVGAGS